MQSNPKNNSAISTFNFQLNQISFKWERGGFYSSSRNLGRGRGGGGGSVEESKNLSRYLTAVWLLCYLHTSQIPVRLFRSKLNDKLTILDFSKVGMESWGPNQKVPALSFFLLFLSVCRRGVGQQSHGRLIKAVQLERTSDSATWPPEDATHTNIKTAEKELLSFMITALHLTTAKKNSKAQIMTL